MTVKEIELRPKPSAVSQLIEFVNANKHGNGLDWRHDLDRHHLRSIFASFQAANATNFKARTEEGAWMLELNVNSKVLKGEGLSFLQALKVLADRYTCALMN